MSHLIAVLCAEAFILKLCCKQNKETIRMNPKKKGSLVVEDVAMLVCATCLSNAVGT